MPRKPIDPKYFRERQDIRDRIMKAGIRIQDLAIALEPPQSPTTLYARLSGAQGLMPEMEKNLIETIEKMSAQKANA